MIDQEQPYETEMLKSMETALAIPDVYIRKRGFGFPQQQQDHQARTSRF